MLLSEELLDLPDFAISKVTQENNEIHIWGASILSEGLCPTTMRRSIRVKQKRERVLRDLPILNKAVHVHMTTRQFQMGQGTFWEQFSFARKGSGMTRRYEQHIHQSCVGTQHNYVAQREGLSEDTVRRLFHIYAKKN